MRVTDAPVEGIDFDWTNQYRTRISQRLPRKFLELYFEAVERGDKFVDYWTTGGNRIVGRIHPDGHLDYIVNPEPTMVKK